LTELPDYGLLLGSNCTNSSHITPVGAGVQQASPTSAGLFSGRDGKKASERSQAARWLYFKELANGLTPDLTLQTLLRQTQCAD